MRSTIRLALRQHRLGFGLLFGGMGLLLALELGAAFWLTTSEPQFCLGIYTDPNVAGLTPPEVHAIEVRCDLVSLVIGVGGGIIAFGANGLPLIAAALIAIPLIAAELELGTATLAWTLARSRRAWLLPRVGLLLVTAIGLSAAAGLMLDELVGQSIAMAHVPDITPWTTFTAYEMRGIIIPARVLVMIGAGLLAGAMTGRQMSGLVVGAAVAGAILLGLINVNDEINRSNAREYEGTGLSYDWGQVEIATGKRLTWEEADAIAAWDDPKRGDLIRDVQSGIPDSDAPLVVARSTALHTVIGFALIGLTFVVVERRKPY